MVDWSEPTINSMDWRVRGASGFFPHDGHDGWDWLRGELHGAGGSGQYLRGTGWGDASAARRSALWAQTALMGIDRPFLEEYLGK